jgi:hypothetical protein
MLEKENMVLKSKLGLISMLCTDAFPGDEMVDDTETKRKTNCKRPIVPPLMVSTPAAKLLARFQREHQTQFPRGTYIKKKELLPWVVAAFEPWLSTKDLKTDVNAFLCQLRSVNPHSLRVADVLPQIQSEHTQIREAALVLCSLGNHCV